MKTTKFTPNKDTLTFTITDKYDREFIFATNNSEVYDEICATFMTSQRVEREIVVEDELGIFMFPCLQYIFTPNEDNDYVRLEQLDEWVKYQMPGFNYEFTDDNGNPWWSVNNTTLTLWYSEHYKWYKSLLALYETINNLNISMMSADKKKLRRLEKYLDFCNKKLENMDADCIDVVEVLSTPISRWRHITSVQDYVLAQNEIYSK